MNTIKEFKNYTAVHNFLNPNDPIKTWITKETYSNIYLEDWNALIEVVEKILNLKDTYAQERQKVFNSINPNIQTTYNACVEFINWYNQQKN